MSRFLQKCSYNRCNYFFKIVSFVYLDNEGSQIECFLKLYFFKKLFTNYFLGP